jgi:16S rRNA processing protein RimM
VAKRPDYIVIGRFGRPRGVSGEICITPATDDPNRFAELREVIVVGPGRRETVKLETVTMIGGRPVVRVEGINSREEAAKLTGLSIEIPIELLRPLPDGRYYQFDLIGCRVEGADGADYGVIEEVMFYPASDLYRVVSERFGEVLFPAVDRYVIRIDIAAKKVIIDPPAGLFVPKEDAT